MSYCTLLLVKKSETELIKKEISQNHSKFARGFPFVISTKYYSQKDFKNITQIHNDFLQYDIVCIENYSSSFAHIVSLWNNEYLDQGIEKLKKQGWSESKIQEHREREKARIERLSIPSQNKKLEIEKILFELANTYFISFVYYWQGKNADRKEWDGFKEMKKISKVQEKYEENIIYQILIEKNKSK